MLKKLTFWFTEQYSSSKFLNPLEKYRGITLLSFPGSSRQNVVEPYKKVHQTPNFENNGLDFLQSDHVPTKLRNYGSLLSNQLSEIFHHTSTSLFMRKHLTVWIGEPYGSFFVCKGELRTIGWRLLFGGQCFTRVNRHI